MKKALIKQMINTVQVGPITIELGHLNNQIAYLVLQDTIAQLQQAPQHLNAVQGTIALADLALLNRQIKQEDSVNKDMCASWVLQLQYLILLILLKATRVLKDTGA